MPKLGKSQREKDVTKVVSIAALRDGKLLFGLRGDSGKWNMPGGHAEPGESMETAARRELKEETGLEPNIQGLEPLGFCDVKEGLRVYSFLCRVEGEPTAEDDPDEEIVAFKWLDPKALPKSVMENLHNKKDVTLQFLGLQDRDLDLIWDEEAPRKWEIEKLSKGGKAWKSKDGITIPAHGTPEREDWNNRYHEALVREYAQGDANRLKPVTLNVGDPGVTGVNMAVNKPRLNLYQRMARAGEPLPPAVVRRSGQGWILIDGNHRWEAAQAAKIPTIQAYEVTPLQSPPVPAQASKGKKVKKGELEDEGKPDLAKMAQTDLSLTKAQIDYNTPEFKSWFDGSHVAHPDGKPKIVYHGTSKDKDFGSFNSPQRGIWFTESPEAASSYAQTNDSQNHKYDPTTRRFVAVNQSPRVYPVHLAIKNPYVYTEADKQAMAAADAKGESHRKRFEADLAFRAKQDGHDGINYGGGTWLAFHPHQVKSVFNNTPTEHKHILKAEGAVARPSFEEIVARAQRVHDRINEIAAQGPKPSRWPARHGGHVIVSEDASKPGRWRATRITEAGEPIGHVEAADHLGALKAAHYSGADFLGETQIQKMELWLAKATRSEDLKRLAQAVTPEGRQYVDHVGQMQEHPPEHNEAVEHYRNEVLGGSRIYAKSKPKISNGITRKVIYETKSSPQAEMFSTSPHGMDASYMVKPYHEAIPKRIQSWQKFPIQGWAEMANQRLYHAAGLGHLHQRVHVSEHDMGSGHEKEPALVIHMEKGYKPIFEAGSYESGHENAHDALKIGLMDFLTNNLDRHHGNLMVKTQERPDIPHEGPPRPGWGALGDMPQRQLPLLTGLKAIDHSRSFQYMNNADHKWDGRAAIKRIPHLEDSFSSYLWGNSHYRPAVGSLIPRPRSFDEQQDFLEQHGKPLFDWWEKVSPNVKAAMEQQLSHIKDPVARAHVKRNFDERAKWLDERAQMGIDNYGLQWYHDPVAQYKPDQKTYDEIEAETRAKAIEEWEKEAAAKGIKP